MNVWPGPWPASLWPWQRDWLSRPFLKLLPAAPDAEGVRRVTERLGMWFSVGSLTADFGLALDPLSGIMVLFITGVGLLIHIFATGYMHGDEGYVRFLLR